VKFGKWIGYVAGAVVVLMAVLMLAHNRWWSPAARVRATVERAKESLSKRDTQGVLELIAEDFEQGGMDKGRLAEVLKMFYDEFDRVAITLGEHRISLSGQAAVDSIKVVVVASKGDQQGYLLGQFGRPAQLGVKLKRRGRWQITGVEGLSGY